MKDREELLNLKEGTLITLIVGKDVDGRDIIHVTRLKHELVTDYCYYWRGLEYTYKNIRITERQDFQRLVKQEELKHNRVLQNILNLQKEYYKE